MNNIYKGNVVVNNMRKKQYGLARILSTGLAVVGLNNVVNSNVIIKTQPEQNTVVADGVTEYRLDVRGDTTQHPDKQIDYAKWSLYIPDQVSFTRAELPDPVNNPSQSPDDFFFGWYMYPSLNYVDNTLGSSGPTGWTKFLGDNSRLVDTNTGPSNVPDKALGYYWFKVPVGSIGSDLYFRMGGVKLTATDGTTYTLSNGNLTRQDVRFTIAPPVWCDVTGEKGKRDGKVNSYDIAEFRKCLSGPALAYSAGCGWADRDGDGDVDQSDFGRFQRCYSGDNIQTNVNCDEGN